MLDHPLHTESQSSFLPEGLHPQWRGERQEIGLWQEDNNIQARGRLSQRFAPKFAQREFEERLQRFWEREWFWTALLLWSEILKIAQQMERKWSDLGLFKFIHGQSKPLWLQEEALPPWSAIDESSKSNELNSGAAPAHVQLHFSGYQEPVQAQDQRQGHFHAELPALGLPARHDL